MPYADREKNLQYWRDYYHQHKDVKSPQQRKSSLKVKFNMTLEDYDKLLIKQDFKCALCNKHVSEFKHNLAVDHCHETGRIRGLLCVSCNTSLGHLGDTPASIQRVFNYVSQGI